MNTPALPQSEPLSDVEGEAALKAPYLSPELTEYGTLADLTQIHGGPPYDDSTGYGSREQN